MDTGNVLKIISKDTLLSIGISWLMYLLHFTVTNGQIAMGEVTS